MYCPKCGTENVDDVSFCRGCGVNLSLVPQALSGRLPEAANVDGDEEKLRREEPPNLTYALVKTLVGIALIIVALAIKDSWQIAGHIWWFWMLIPAAGSLGSGIAEFLRLNQQQKSNQLTAGHAYVPPAISGASTPAAAVRLPPPPRAHQDIYTPTSVTENTTKLLDQDR